MPSHWQRQQVTAAGPGSDIVSILDVAVLLEPVSADRPCGRDLAQGGELYLLRHDAEEPAEPGLKGQVAIDSRNWPELSRRAQALLGQSKDLRVAVVLTRALLRTQGIVGLCAGLGLIKDLLEKYWDGLYPPLVGDDGTPDPDLRINVLRELWTLQTLNEIRGARLLSVPSVGDLNVGDLLAAKATSAAKPGTSRHPPQLVLRAIAENAPADLRLLVHRARENLAALNRSLHAKVGNGHGALAEPLDQLLERVAHALGEPADTPSHTNGKHSETGTLPGGMVAHRDETSASSPPEHTRMQISGEVQTREDVINMLDKICTYYSQREPSSPVPLLMQRAKRLVGMNFVDIMRELADKGLPQVEAVTGKESKTQG